MRFHLFIFDTGTLSEAAGLLLSIAFHWGVTTLFRVPAKSCIDRNGGMIFILVPSHLCTL